MDQMIDVAAWFVRLGGHAEAIFSGRLEPVREAENGDPFFACLAELLIHNGTLWGHEDEVRRTDISDAEVVKYKRLIDQENQARNNCIDQADHILRDTVYVDEKQAGEGASINTETPGSAFDRLSIMALRIRSLKAEIAREDATVEHRERCSTKQREVEERVADLSNSLQELLDDIQAGRKRLKSYNTHKLYNDPETNPAVRANL